VTGVSPGWSWCQSCCLSVSLQPTGLCPLGPALTDLLSQCCLLHTAVAGAFPSRQGSFSPPLLCPAPCPTEALLLGEGMAVGGTAELRDAGFCLVAAELGCLWLWWCTARQVSWPCGKGGCPRWYRPPPSRVACGTKWGFVVAATSPCVHQFNTRHADVLPFSYSSSGSMAFSQGC